MYVPTGHVSQLDLDAVELYGATRAELERVWGWLLGTPVENEQPLPYTRLPRSAYNLPPACAAYCKAAAAAAAQKGGSGKKKMP